MKEIASNDFYTIVVDQAKNRLYITGRGKWVDRKDVSAFVSHLKKAIGLLSSGFTLISDMRKREVNLLDDLTHEVLGILAEADVKKVAIVWKNKHEQVLSEIGMDTAAERTGPGYAEKRKNFFDFDEAEEWLDKSQ